MPESTTIDDNQTFAERFLGIEDAPTDGTILETDIGDEDESEGAKYLCIHESDNLPGELDALITPEPSYYRRHHRERDDLEHHPLRKFPVFLARQGDHIAEFLNWEPPWLGNKALYVAIAVFNVRSMRDRSWSKSMPDDLTPYVLTLSEDGLETVIEHLRASVPARQQVPLRIIE